MVTLEKPAVSTPSVAALFRRAAGFIASGVALVWNDDVVMTVSSLHPVSLDPPWISLSLGHGSRKGRSILAGKIFRARLLMSDEEAATRSDEVSNAGGLAEFECRIRWVEPVGDHDVVLAEVSDIAIRGGDPLLYWRRGLHSFKARYPFVETTDAFRNFVETWEAGALPRCAWTHAAHVAIGACYAVRYGRDAFDPLRRGIKRHNASVGTVDSATSGYHETLTRFWFETVSREIADLGDAWTAACRAVERFGEERDLHRLYYSFDVVKDARARLTWVPPDLCPEERDGR